jgi:7,8-dihydro-6-hydroxymethylpterin-pyrophosphokinase
MHERAFVLLPLLELDPDPLLPADRRVTGLPLDPSTRASVRTFAPPIDVP